MCQRLSHKKILAPQLYNSDIIRNHCAALGPVQPLYFCKNKEGTSTKYAYKQRLYKEEGCSLYNDCHCFVKFSVCSVIQRQRFLARLDIKFD